MLPHLVATLRTLIAFVVVLGVLVFVHELGHYLAARWRGVQVEVFSIGFGRAFASWTDRAGTVWKLAWLPLGGYVKLHGQERPEDVAARGARAAGSTGQTFQDKPVGSRAHRSSPPGRSANFVLADGAVRAAVRDRGPAGGAARGGRAWCPPAPPPPPACTPATACSRSTGSRSAASRTSSASSSPAPAST